MKRYATAAFLAMCLLQTKEAEATWAHRGGFWYWAGGTVAYRRVPVYVNGCCVNYSYVPAVINRTTTINNYPPAPPRDWKNTGLDAARNQDELEAYLETQRILNTRKGVYGYSRSSSGSYQSSTYTGPVGQYGATFSGLASLVGQADPAWLSLADNQWAEGHRESTRALHLSHNNQLGKEYEVRKFLGAAHAVRTVLQGQAGTTTTYGGSYNNNPSYPQPVPIPVQVPQPNRAMPFADQSNGNGGQQRFFQVRQARCGSCHEKPGSSRATTFFQDWDRYTVAQKMNTIWMRINSPDPNIHMPRTPDDNVYELPDDEKKLFMSN